MQPISGRELLATLRIKHSSGAGLDSFVQILISVLAGTCWWFGMFYYLMGRQQEDTSTWYILVMALPCAIITMGWYFGIAAFVKYQRQIYADHVMGVFSSTDLALQLMQPELPEQLANTVGRQKLPGGFVIQQRQGIVAARISMVLERFPGVCRALGKRAFPRPWAQMESALVYAMPLFVLALVLLDPNSFRVGLLALVPIAVVFLLLALCSLKLALYSARSAAVANCLAISLSEGIDVTEDNGS